MHQWFDVQLNQKSWTVSNVAGYVNYKLAYGLCQTGWNRGPLFGLFLSSLPLYFTLSDIVHILYWPDDSSQVGKFLELILVFSFLYSLFFCCQDQNLLYICSSFWSIVWCCQPHLCKSMLVKILSLSFYWPFLEFLKQDKS